MRDLFPSLYVLVVDKDATIADYCHRGSGAVVWTPIFIRDGFVDDISLATFLNLLNEFSPLDSPMQSLGISTLEELSLSNLII